MTGPNYPLDPAAGSNALDQYDIGVDALGDLVPFSFWQTIISQYANSEIITTLIGNFAAQLDQTRNMSDFYDTIWNVSTAVDKGLDVWGRIVGVNRVMQVATGGWFGFNEAGPAAMTFNNGVFFNGISATSSFSVTNETYRQLIFAKALFNISNGSIQSINQILMSLFPNRGNCYVTDGIQGTAYFGFAEAQNCLPFNIGVFYNGEAIPFMAIQYVFLFPLQPLELSIVQSSGVLPKPTGVSASVEIYA